MVIKTWFPILNSLCFYPPQFCVPENPFKVIHESFIFLHIKNESCFYTTTATSHPFYNLQSAIELLHQSTDGTFFFQHPWQFSVICHQVLFSYLVNSLVQLTRSSVHSLFLPCALLSSLTYSHICIFLLVMGINCKIIGFICSFAVRKILKNHCSLLSGSSSLL